MKEEIVKETNDPTEYPEAICMSCGDICSTTEHVDIGMGEYELWCWCPKCEIDTFHQLPIEFRYRRKNKS